MWMLCSYAFAETDKGLVYVAKYAMQTARSKNFQDLTQNIFNDLKAKENVLAFLKRNEILSRSLPDVIAEGNVLTIKERSQNTTLDLSKVDQKKLVYNGHEIIFTGDEAFIDIYRTFLKKQPKKRTTWFSWFFSEAEASMPVISVVALSTYALAVIKEESASLPKPQAVSSPKPKARRANR